MNQNTRSESRGTRGMGILAAAASLLLGSPALADIVLEQNPNTTPAGARVEDRSSLHDAIGASERLRTGRKATARKAAPASGRRLQATESETLAGAPTAPVAPIGGAARRPVLVAEEAPAPGLIAMGSVSEIAEPQQQQSASEISSLSKAELMRRERVREEVKNEDILQERLEELRLRDEQKRTEQLIQQAKVNGDADAAAAELSAGQPAITVIPPNQVEEVGPTAVDRPGEPVPARAAASTSMGATVSGSMQAGHVFDDEPAEEKTQIGLAPRVGLSSMSDTNGVTVTGRYSAGVGIDVGASDNMVFQIGYTYSEYGVGMNGYQQPAFNVTSSQQVLALKQNVFDIGLKFYLLGRDSKLRPFVGGGGGYSKAYLNYDQQNVNLYTGTSNPLPADYELTQFLGVLSAGLDVKISKSVTVGGVFKYHTVLSSQESGQLDQRGFYNPALYGAGYAGAGPVAAADPVQQVAGASLARSGFYSILANVNFVF